VLALAISACAGRSTARHGDPADRDLRGEEWTVPEFAIAPYLPAASDSLLRRLLETADGLAHRSGKDGVPYAQHGWEAKTDAENLALGIDCSRAVWFAYTRSGIRYNAHDGYLSTGDMVSPESPMREAFDRCDAQPIQLGDLLVYRNERKNRGHVVMVIDPARRIAWGSHGWDGSVPRGHAGDTGVEYQQIVAMRAWDWNRWDNREYERRACWRNRIIAAELEALRGL
jgi:hypothetical protein